MNKIISMPCNIPCNIPCITKTFRLACKSKYNRKRDYQVVLLMITNGKKWHYLALKSVRTNEYNRPIRRFVRIT